MSNPFFDSSAYYGFLNSLNTSCYLTLGWNGGVPGLPFETGDSYSSNNWQIFFQDPIYFIRNYDHGADYHLAIPSTGGSQPQLLRSSGGLGHQWNITSRSDGSKRLVNMLVGEHQPLGLGTTSEGTIIPLLSSDDSSSHWMFEINSSAGKASAQMLEAVPSLATPTSSATPSASSISSSATISASATSNSDTGVSGGIIAGTVAAVVTVTVFMFIGMCIWVRRRKLRNRKGGAAQPKDLPADRLESCSELSVRKPKPQLAELSDSKAAQPTVQSRNPRLAELGAS